MSSISIEESSSSNKTDDQMTNHMLKKELFMKVMGGKWEEVMEIHAKDRRAYSTKITNTGRTAFHEAVCQEKVEIVEKLVDQLINKRDSNNINDEVSEAKEILSIKTARSGHTPLHMAAASGSLRMCRYIAGVDKSLVLARDKKGQTPLFRAVSYGRKQVFLYLHSVVFGDDLRTDMLDVIKKSCCRDDGQTILHNAIVMEHFGLAFQIIRLNKELINFVDEKGEYPLHALARKSAAFRSGSNLQGRDKIICNCISVKELEFDSVALQKYSDPKEELEDEKSYPPHTFFNSVGLLSRNVTQTLAGYHVKEESGAKNVDVENREGRIDLTGSNIADQEHQHFFSASYMSSWFKYYFKLASRAIVPVLFRYGKMSIKKIQKAKEKHVWAVQVLNELLKHDTMYASNESLILNKRSKGQKKFQNNSDDYEDSRDQSNSDEEDGENVPEISKISEQPSYTNISGKVECSRKETKDTPILVAAKYGVAEIVEKILERFPVAIHDKDKDGKTVLLVAVEKRNLQVYKTLINKNSGENYVFLRVDKKGNTALHYAAMYKEEQIKPWPVPGAALQMQWEIKWHEFVKNTMPARVYLRTNEEGQTPMELFSQTHKELVKAGGKWLSSTATSCSVVAALIATVAFASSSTAPGGTDTKSGQPKLRRSPTFELFAMSSLVALCFSVTSLIMFLAILTSRHHEKDFGKDLPRKILFGLTSLFVSIASMLVAFCAGHFIVFEDKFKYAASVYAVTLLPLFLFAAAQFPLYLDLLLATFRSPFQI